MLVKTTGIVLSKLKYQEHSLIVKCYTKDFGVKSYLLSYVLKNKKGKINPAYFQVLSQIEYSAIHKSNKDLHKISEVKLNNIYQSLHSNLYKGTTSLFLSEILSSLLIEEEANFDLYNYLESALLWYDLNEFNPNFHLLFLLKLSKHLGCYPNDEMVEDYFFTKPNSSNKKALIKELLGTNFDALINIKLNASLRQEILQEILQYFSVHLGTFKQPKSLSILHDVFK